MKSRRTAPILIAAVLGGGLAGWWLTRTTIPEEAPRPVTKQAAPPMLSDPAPKASKLGERKTGMVRVADAAEAGALQNQRSIRFSDRDAYERFLAAAKGKGIAILGSIDQLNALHVGFLSLDELNALLDGSEESGFIFPVSLPTPKTEGVQDGAVGFGESLLSWLGITGDNSSYGKGRKFAVLDTGSTLPGADNRYLVDPPEDPADWNWHGTGVVDLILQIAPAADVISWRVANDKGQSNSFIIAQAIVAAVAAGAEAINISMGSYGNSPIMRDAVDVALEANVMIFASAGNEGYEQLAYPAAYEGVVGVGAVDANGTYLNFSNTGNVTMTAPGLDLVTAWTGGQSVYFSGTSASTPISLGVLAAAASHNGNHISMRQAYERVISNLNDAGAPGLDNYYGIGMVDLGRALQAGQTGITDAAIASNFVSTGNGGQPQLQVTVQNRGTTTLVNTPVEVTTPAGTTKLNITTLQAGHITTFNLPLSLKDGSAVVQSRVEVSGGNPDLKPSNNRRTDVYTPPATRD